MNTCTTCGQVLPHARPIEPIAHVWALGTPRAELPYEDFGPPLTPSDIADALEPTYPRSRWFQFWSTFREWLPILIIAPVAGAVIGWLIAIILVP